MRTFESDKSIAISFGSFLKLTQMKSHIESLLFRRDNCPVLWEVIIRIILGIVGAIKSVVQAIGARFN